MPLSEYEQRVLEQLERDLGSDPQLGRAMKRGPRPRARIAVGALGVLVGLGVVVIGAVSQMLWLGVLGFAVMIGVALWALLAPAPSPGAAKGSSKGDGPHGGKSGRRKDERSFMQRLEERYERRREQGDL